MDITHNQINASIAEMEHISAKGQPYAKRNKERRVRAVLRQMREDQRQVPFLKEVWFYFWLWLRRQMTITNLILWEYYNVKGKEV